MCSDEVVVLVPPSVVQMSKFVQKALGEYYSVYSFLMGRSSSHPNHISQHTENSLDRKVRIPKVTSHTLSHVMEFCQHYSLMEPLEEIMQPVTSQNMADVVTPKWYADYCARIEGDLWALIPAALILEIQPLVELLAAQTASMIQNKSPEEIRETFALPDGPMEDVGGGEEK